MFERDFFIVARGRTRFLKRMRNLGRPRPLLVAIEQATYRPIAQGMYDAELARVVARAPALMEAELADAINQGGVIGVSFWRAFQDIPADGPEPGEFPWGRISAELAIPPKPSILPVSVLGAIPGGGAVLWHATLGLAGQLPAALAGSAFRLLTATTNELVLTLRKKGNGGVTPTGSAVATITFPAGGTVGTLAVTAPGGLVPLIAGDTLVLTGPAAADATAAGLAASLAYAQA
ncbi:hypothetical protein BV511_15700 [Methylorubrum extorquens]|uniref:hypothetical protein n=1 Tax=Methylorubrum extorquens TaxID=408 RepID=UPI000972E8E0|nr:hypothetical protein [Methylorubrum extorquens]APX86017.1 hypothetical protein BV511_15700 [Methylorubrum extorquens]